MIYLNALGQHVIVLGSLEMAADLFEKRSSNYSDRKQPTMMIDLCVYQILLASRICQE